MLGAAQMPASEEQGKPYQDEYYCVEPSIENHSEVQGETSVGDEPDQDR